MFFVGESDVSTESKAEEIAFFTQKLAKRAKSLVVVCLYAPKDLSLFESASAIIVGWRSGEAAGKAVGEIVRGESPVGRLPYPIKRGEVDGKPQYYPFGFGISYSEAIVPFAVLTDGKVKIRVNNDALGYRRESVLIAVRDGENYRLVDFAKTVIASMGMKDFFFDLGAEGDGKDLFAIFPARADGSERIIKIEKI